MLRPKYMFYLKVLSLFRQQFLQILHWLLVFRFHRLLTKFWVNFLGERKARDSRIQTCLSFFGPHIFFLQYWGQNSSGRVLRQKLLSNFMIRLNIILRNCEFTLKTLEYSRWRSIYLVLTSYQKVVDSSSKKWGQKESFRSLVNLVGSIFYPLESHILECEELLCGNFLQENWISCTHCYFNSAILQYLKLCFTFWISEVCYP